MTKSLIKEISNKGYGYIQTFDTEIGEFNVQRKDLLDYYGNPVYIICPVGYIESLPKVSGTRRNFEKEWYTMQSYNIEEDMVHFLNKLKKQIALGHKLYHNQ